MTAAIMIPIVQRNHRWIRETSFLKVHKPMLSAKAAALFRSMARIQSAFGGSDQHVQTKGQAASDLIRTVIENGSPALIARFGWTELDCILNCLLLRDCSRWQRMKNRVRGIPFRRIFDDETKHLMNRQSGFFPPTDDCLQKFVDLMLGDMTQVDILASWMKQERYVLPMMKHKLQTIGLEDLPPFHHEHPWSEALQGRRVLVVHPFKQTILNQFQKRDALFKDKRVLPDCDLEVVQAVQSLGLNGTQYVGSRKLHCETWFDALDYMKAEVATKSFDVAIIGCGAYGMPLAAFIKQMGKIAIHLGGTTQCLFGIKGKRWEAEYNYQNRFYNEFWVRPAEEETRKEFLGVDNGAYW